MNGIEALMCLKEGKIIRHRGIIFRLNLERHDVDFKVGDEGWSRCPQVEYFLFHDDGYEVVENVDYPLSYREALHAMIDGKECANEKYPDTGYRFSSCGSFCSRANPRVIFDSSERVVGWRIVEGSE